MKKVKIKLEEFLCALPLEDNNAVFNLCCRLCSAYERKTCFDCGFIYIPPYVIYYCFSRFQEERKVANVHQEE